MFEQEIKNSPTWKELSKNQQIQIKNRLKKMSAQDQSDFLAMLQKSDHRINKIELAAAKSAEKAKQDFALKTKNLTKKAIHTARQAEEATSKKGDSHKLSQLIKDLN